MEAPSPPNAEKHPQETALQHLFEDPNTPIQNPNASSCITGFTNVMYGYYKNFVYPLIDNDYKTKDTDWEINFEALTDMEYVGAGAFGKVYSAKLNGEIVAVKIPEDSKETDMKYLKDLRHENIVRFRGVCVNTTTPCVVMDFCQYGSLYNFLHSGSRIMLNITFKWAKEIALAMSYLHSRNIIHRDLKSPNILIADNLVVKISDFGTSRKWEKYSFVMTTLGTTYWMAPEMMLGKKCSDKIDVWSYGVVLWELLTQEVPYENLHPCAVTYGVGKETISLPLPTTFPLHLRILMNHCWHRDPKCRPSFHRITEVLNLASDQWNWLGDELFMTMQDTWRQEVQICMKNGWHAVPREQVQVVQPQKQNKMLYKKIMVEASKMYMDACTLYLHLEQREVALTEREMAYNGLMNHRSLFKRSRNSHSSRRSSSSSPSPSLGKMSVVKLNNIRKPQTITEIVSGVSFNDELLQTKLPDTLIKSTVLPANIPDLAVPCCSKTLMTTNKSSDKVNTAAQRTIPEVTNTGNADVEDASSLKSPAGDKPADFPVPAVKETEHVKSFINRTTMADASLIKIYGKIPRGETSKIFGKPFNTSVDKVDVTKDDIGKTNKADSLSKLARDKIDSSGISIPKVKETKDLGEGSKAMDDVDNVPKVSKKPSVGLILRHAQRIENERAANVNKENHEIPMTKAKASNSNRANELATESTKTHKAQKAFVDKHVLNKAKLNRLAKTLAESGIETKPNVKTKIKPSMTNDFKFSVTNQFITKFTDSKVPKTDTFVAKHGTKVTLRQYTDSCPNTTIIKPIDTAAKKDDLNGNFNKSNIVRDDKINDNVINEAVSV